MDPRLLRHYNQELQHLREMGAEFAAEFPKIAARLRMDSLEIADPYVERLLEGVAFLTARLQLRLDAEFPRFTQRLLDILFPQYLAPVPSMLVAHVVPNLGDGALAAGVTLPRGTALRSASTKAGPTPCEFRTGFDLDLWPVEVAAVEYFSHVADLPLGSHARWRRAAGGVRIRLRAGGGLDFSRIAWQDVRLHCSGSDAVAYRLHELLCGHALGVLVRPATKGATALQALPGDAVEPVGFDDDEALLPVTLRGYAGYRLLQEYYALPQRFLFFDVRGAGAALQRIGGREAEIVVLLSRGDAALQQSVDASHLSLHCVPAINLFERRCDRIHVSAETHDYHVVADRARPMDYEVHEVTGVTGYGVGAASEREFTPLYSAFRGDAQAAQAYYAVQREPRMWSAAQKREGVRAGYVGSEVYLSIVDTEDAPYSRDLRQLGVRALCSNRDLPLLMPHGGADGDLALQASAPVLAVRVPRRPSRPLAAVREARAAWKLINQLSLNHLSLTDTDAQQGAAALRDILRLYLPEGDAGWQRQVEGVRSARIAPTVRRLPMPGPIAFGRGVQIDVEVDDLAFEGGSAYLLGLVLERFFARHVALNNFTATRVSSPARGTILDGRPRCGSRPIL